MLHPLQTYDETQQVVIGDTRLSARYGRLHEIMTYVGQIRDC